MVYSHIKSHLRDVFLDRFNNYLTDEKFAEHYGLTLEEAQLVIKAGRLLHERYVEETKLYNRSKL